MRSMSYGVMPSKKVFRAQWSKIMGDREYRYTLRGEDASAARAARVAEEGSFGEAELYSIIKKLRNAWAKGNDEAGSIASSLLYTLDLEWV